jgi:hypothetical protein
MLKPRGSMVGRAFVLALTGILGGGLAPQAGRAWASPSSTLAAACADALGRDPTPGLDTFTSPAGGSHVRAGETIELTAAWRPTSFDAASVDAVLACVTVDGRLLPELSAQARLVPNGGEFTHRLTVPTGLSPGSSLCARSFVSGPGFDAAAVTEAGQDVCFTAAGSETTAAMADGGPVYTAGRRSPRPPHVEPPAAIAEPVVDTSPPIEPAPTPGPPASPPTPPPADIPPALPQSEVEQTAVEPTVQSSPEPSPPVLADAPAAVAPPARLASTGMGSRLALVAAGLLLALGGLAVAGGPGSAPLTISRQLRSRAGSHR